MLGDVLEKRGYLGIDESNHGKYPEIFVGVYSENLEDIVEHQKLPKIRTARRSIDPLLGDREFKYILISEKYGRLLHNQCVNLVVFSEFVHHFGNLEKVIIDGETNLFMLSDFKKVLQPTKYPQIECVAKADIKYPLVNIADNIANLLYRDFTRSHSSYVCKKYISNLIEPDMENYLKLFKQLCIL